MNKEEFYENLIKASEAVYPFTCEMVTNELPPAFKYIVKIYSNFTEAIQADEMTFPHVKKLNQTTAPIDAKEVIDILWMNYAIPEWINIQVEDYDAEFTYLSLDCCGRYSKLKKHLYHVAEGHPPFHCLSPALPLSAMNEKDGSITKFDLHWKKNRTEPKKK